MGHCRLPAFEERRVHRPFVEHQRRGRGATSRIDVEIEAYILQFGGMLLDGQRTNFKAQVLATSVLCVLLALVLDLLLVLVERVLTPWVRRTEVAT